MKKAYRLTASAPSVSVNLPPDREWSTLVVYNPTGSPIYLRTGAPNIPTADSPDLIFPAACGQTAPIQGREFGALLGDTSLLSGGADATLSGLYDTCFLWFLDNTEIVPTFGAFSFQNLSLSPLTNGVVTYTAGTSSAVFDLAPWGGAIIAIDPADASGQALVIIEASSDAAFPATTQTMQLVLQALWPGTPGIFVLPRTLRYLRVRFLTTGIAGEAAISGGYAVRASLAELQQIAYNPGDQGITKTWNIPSLSQVSYTFATHNVGAVSVELTSTSAGSESAELLIEVSDAVAGPWRLASFREQILNPTGIYQSIYRSVGDLGLFLRLTILEIGNTGPITGTLSVSIRREPDLTAIVQSIYAAVGDPGAPVNVSQSVYHTLRNILTSLGTVAGSTLTTISINIAAIYTSIGTSLGSTVTAMAGTLSNIYNSIGTTVGSTLSSILTQATTIASNTGKPIGTAGTASGVTACPAVGYTNTGVDISTGWYIERIYMYYTMTGNIPGLDFRMGFVLGSAGAPAVTVTQSYCTTMPSGLVMVDITGPRGAGSVVAAGTNRVWIYTEGAPVTVSWIAVIGSP